MEFNNPIVGEEELIRSAIRSQDYVEDVSGWRIAADGTAEFATILIRRLGDGDVIVVGADTEPQVVISASGNSGIIKFPTNGPVENFISRIIASRGNEAFPDEYASLQIDGPSVDTFDDKIQIQMNSQNADGSSSANFQVRTLNNGVLLAADSTSFSIFKPLSVSNYLVVDGVNQGKGVRNYIARTTNTAAITTTETVALTSASVEFEAGRAYRISTSGLCQSTVSGDAIRTRFRRTGVAGTLLQDSNTTFQVNGAASNRLFQMEQYVINSTGASINDVICLTYDRGLGTGSVHIAASVTLPTWMQIEDVGAASDYPNARTL